MRKRLFLVLLLAAAPLAAQLSPGKLSQPHAGLEGSANCLKCHQTGKGVAPARCLDCHTEIKSRIAAGRGLHARKDYQTCQTCHIEHHGREFQLVYWGKQGQAAFDHRQTGYPLEGAHAKQACRSCHQPKNIRNKQPLQARGKNLAKTFLGLERGCLSCHQDEHRGQFAPASCVSCHTMTSWRPPAKFDHARTSFPLTGLHQKVACASCHPQKGEPGKEFLVLKGLKHQKCSDCHKDPHQGRMGPTCQQCHSTAKTWKSGALAGFDHSRTGFPLTGRHREISCQSCHKTSFTKLAHQRCTDCHKDPHQGRMGPTCQQCHSTASWSAGARGKFDHSKTRFPLRGKHQQVACQQCHTSGRGLRFARFQACADCHRDAHAGQLAPKTCESCHKVEGFSPSTFTLEMHQKSGYPLQGSHLAVPCISCHERVPASELPAKFRAQAGSARLLQFRWESKECASCHGDPHKGQTSRVAGAQGCRSCHSIEGWTHLAAFDHARTGFPLEGGHQRVSCGGCHRTADKKTRFAGTPRACNACHGDPHEGQFIREARNGAEVACQSCHSVQGWARVTFDHDRHSRFKLVGAHTRLSCGACHRPESRGGRTVVRFKPLPVDCEGCHSRAPANPGRRS